MTANANNNQQENQEHPKDGPNNAPETAAENAPKQENAPSSPAVDHEAEAAKMRDQWMRALAEIDNLRKRSQRDVEEAGKYATTAFARDMVNVLENLQRASESIPAEKRESDDKLKSIADGVEMTLRELLNVFERHGIRRIDPKGEKFNHHYHQAVMQVESADIQPGMVVQVLQAGYVIHDRLLRPAMVTVSKAKGQADTKVDTSA